MDLAQDINIRSYGDIISEMKTDYFPLEIPLPEKKFKNVNCLSTRFLTFAANKETILLFQDR